MIQPKLKELCERLKANDPSLIELNLDYGNLGVDGARALRDALKNNRIVSRIHIHHANLGFKGTKILFEGLKGRGVKTSVSLVDDYTDSEYETLLSMAPHSKKKTKEFRNGKGIDDDVFAKLANNGRGMRETKSKTQEKPVPQQTKEDIK